MTARRLLLAAIVVLAGGLRFAAIGRSPLWFDEICSDLRARGRLSEAFGESSCDRLVRAPSALEAPPGRLRDVVLERAEPGPGLYFLLLRAWRSFGASPAALRSLSALASLLTILVGASLASRTGGPRAGVFAAGLLAVAPLEVYYAQEARPYALAGFLSLLATAALARLAARSGRRAWAVYVAALFLALAAHLTALAVVAAHAAWWLAGGRRVLPRWPFALAAVALLFAPFAWLAVAQVSHLGAYGVSALRPAWPEAPALFAALAGGPGAAVVPGLLLASGLWLLAAGAVIRGEGASKLLALTAAAPPLVLVALDAACGTAHCRTTRYAVMGSAPLLVLAALGLARTTASPRALLRSLVPGLAGAAACAMAWLAAGLAGAPKAPEYPALAAALDAAECDERDLVIFLQPWQQKSFELDFLRRARPYEYALARDLDAAAVERPWRRIYLVVEDDRAAAGARLATRLAARSRDSGERRFRGVTLYAFEG